MTKEWLTLLSLALVVVNEGFKPCPRKMRTELAVGQPAARAILCPGETLVVA